jgi:hypothetical protein
MEESAMNDVILITGAVTYQINLDPTVWIFDDRKIEMDKWIPGVEGWGMHLGPFLEKAQPDPKATKVICHQSTGEKVVLSIDQARSAILRFSRDGKPIRPDGPALLYLADGSNSSQPIGYLTRLEVVCEQKTP